MKFKIIIIATVAFSIFYNQVHGQEIDYNKIIIPQNVKEIDFVERLVQIAWQNYPENRIIEHQINMAKQNIAISGWSWLSNFRASFNANEFTINPEAFEGNLFLPRYNFSIGIELGQFVSIPKATKIARTNLYIEEERLNLQKLKIRTQVITRYEDFSYRSEVLKIENQLTEDINTQFIISEQNFKNGQIEFYEYLRVKQEYLEQVKRNKQAYLEFTTTKVELEELIGVRIDDLQ